MARPFRLFGAVRGLWARLGVLSAGNLSRPSPVQMLQILVPVPRRHKAGPKWAGFKGSGDSVPAKPESSRLFH